MRYAILLSILFAACSPAKRMQRLIDKHPELQRTDTIAVVTTVPPDTIRQATVLRDTVTIQNDRQSVRIIRIPTGSPCDTDAIALDLLAVVKPDTIYSDVYVDRIVPCPEGSTVRPWWRTAAIFSTLLCISLFLLITNTSRR